MDTECREWPGSRSDRGYGTAWTGSKNVRAHRMVFEAAHGPIPSGMVVMHACDNPPCVNIDHLSLGTQGDNNRDRAAKGRSATPRGERNPSSKLTDAQREEIRGRFVADYVRFSGPRMRSNARELAQEFGVTRTTVNNIINRQGEHRE